MEKRLYPGRWHSLTVTVDSVRDEMCVYLDGLAVDKPIDIFESFGMGRPTGGVETMVMWRLGDIWMVGSWILGWFLKVIP